MIRPRPVIFLLRFLRRKLGAGDWAAVIIVCASAAYGMAQLGQGLYMKAKAEFAQYLLDKAWERALAGQSVSKPWPWADTWPVAKLTVPRLGHSAVVLNGVSGEAMAFGPGYHNLSSLPGKPGTSVIAAHRDTHFSFLKYLNVGDIVSLTTKDGKSLGYQVKSLKVVDWNNSGIDPNAPGSRLVLVTCWPFDAMNQGPLRYIVEAEILPAEPEKPTVVQKGSEQHL